MVGIIQNEKMDDIAPILENWLRDGQNSAIQVRKAVENILKDIYSGLSGN